MPAAWWSTFTQDLRYAVRGLRLKPGFAAAVVGTLALGIGANATMFGVVDRLLFRPPAFLISPDRAARLYIVRAFRGKESPTAYVGYRVYLDLREGTHSFDLMTPFTIGKLAVGTSESTREMSVATTGADLWKMFDARPVLGRFFTPAEDQTPDGTRVTVLSYGFWQTEFGGRPNVLGSSIEIGTGKYTIIGVAPAGFVGFATEPVVAFVPMTASQALNTAGMKPPWYDSYNMSWFPIFARRKQGVSVASATADLTIAYQRSYAKAAIANPHAASAALAKPHALVAPVQADRGPNAGNDAKVATWLGGVALIVLLIACANVANLLVGRALRRRREIAVRLALGVSRGRLLRQLLTESALLAILGGLAGLAIAQWGGAGLRTLLLTNMAQSNAWTDTRVLLYAACLTVLAGLLTGLAPAFQAGRTDIAGSLKSGAREGTVHRSRLRVGLLVMQAALSVVLLVGAGLFLRSMINVKNVHLGYDIGEVLWVGLNPRGVTMDSARQVALREQLLARAQRLPGVVHAARGLTIPFWSTFNAGLFVPGLDSVGKLADFTLQAGSPDFFATMGTRILRGRGISPDDRAAAPHVVVVSKGMAERLWPGEDAIGKCIRINADTTPCMTVVGIAEDVRRQSLSEPQFHYYMPSDQYSPRNGGLFVRTVGSAADAAEGIRRALQQLMPGESYVTVTPMSTIIGPYTRSWKLGATMFTVFGALALVIAAIGLYSVIAYSVAQRLHEMGVRVALGAQSGDVIGLIVREGLVIVIPGVAVGAAIALAAGRWIKPLLFDESPKDPAVIVAVVVTLVSVALAASWVPARRAARVDPSEALRSD